MSEIRLQENDRLEDVRAAYLEGNGEISVIARRALTGTETGAERRTLAVGPLPPFLIVAKRAEPGLWRHYGP